MSTNHTIPPIAYGAIYEGETMSTTERERARKYWSLAKGAGLHHGYAPEFDHLAPDIQEKVIDVLAAARLEGEEVDEVEIIGRVSEEDAEALTPVDQMMVRRVPAGVEVWGTDIGMNVRNKRPVDLALVRRREGDATTDAQNDA